MVSLLYEAAIALAANPKKKIGPLADPVVTLAPNQRALRAEPAAVACDSNRPSLAPTKKSPKDTTQVETRTRAPGRAEQTNYGGLAGRGRVLEYAQWGGVASAVAEFHVSGG